MLHAVARLSDGLAARTDTGEGVRRVGKRGAERGGTCQKGCRIRCGCGCGGSRSNLSANHRTPKIENGRKTEREKENRSDVRVRVRPSVRPSLVWPELHGAEEREDTAGQTGRQKRENTRMKQLGVGQ